jgi:hypothetical protein
MRIGKIVRWEKISGEPLTIQNVRLTPQARVLSVRFPFGGFVWNHPDSLIVERAGKRETLAVPDHTLLIQISMAVSVLMFALWFWTGWKGAKK